MDIEKVVCLVREILIAAEDGDWSLIRQSGDFSLVVDEEKKVLIFKNGQDDPVDYYSLDSALKVVFMWHKYFE